LVIGGGPAGLTADIYLSPYRRPHPAARQTRLRHRRLRQFPHPADLLDAYSAMVRGLMDKYYADVTRYTTRGFLRMKPCGALESVASARIFTKARRSLLGPDRERDPPNLVSADKTRHSRAVRTSKMSMAGHVAQPSTSRNERVTLHATSGRSLG
jgi:hypothetical protein